MVVKLLVRVIIAAFPVLFLMAAINYLSDPALVFSNGEYERQVANGILNNKNIGIVTNYNERSLQRFLIEGMKAPPDGIIVGSSRIMSIPPDSLGLENGFCNGVSGATIEDIISIIGMYENRNMLPKSIFIGIDPWLFNDNHGDTRYRELMPEYNDFSAKLNLKRLTSALQSNAWYEKFEQAVSPTYFQASIDNIHVLRGIQRERPAPLVTTGLYLEYTNKLADGSMVYSKEQNEKPIDVIESEVISAINNGDYYHSANYSVLSPVIINQFTNLVNYLQSNNVTVTFILPPFHPLYYTHIVENPEYRMLIESETLVRSFAEERGISVIGSVNPERVDAEAADFYDYIHPTREFMTTMCHKFSNKI